MSASRYPFSLSRDGLLPGFFDRVHPAYHTPYVSVIVTGAFIAVSLFLPLDILVKAASTVMILTNLFCCLSVLILRESRIQNYRPSFRAPLYPWIPLLGCLGFICLLAGMGRAALVTTLLLIFGGLVLYFLYGRRQVSREYALLHLIERITAKELTSRTFENELRDILHERDEVVKDRFDHLVEDAVVLDMTDSISADDLFSRTAGILAEQLNTSPSTLARKLIERERQSSTVLSPFLAIPHIIIDGNHAFSLVIIRCREGVFFSDDLPAVHAIFLLVGTMDERSFHLHTLAAIAGIVHNPSFEDFWMRAKDEHALRDILLLGSRKRFNA
jgi:mannitol/fructose-specific phosphotransferase system IIA component (Ntr-type)